MLETNKSLKKLDLSFANLKIPYKILGKSLLENQTLEFLKQKSNRFYHLIALAPSRVILPDGRNAHLILKSKDWWRDKFIKLGYNITFEKHVQWTKGI